MISISLFNVTLVLGSHPIFQDLSWQIQDGQKIGLIGPNGAGKSSLFKLMVGEFLPEPGGTITRAKGIILSYLPQQPELDPQVTAYETALKGNPRYFDILEILKSVEKSLSDPAVFSDSARLSRVLEQQQTLLEEYESLGGSTYPDRVREMLLNLGLPEDDLEKPVGFLSGGQKKLVNLVVILLQRPDVLLLDEPDNHLDLPGKAYLERLITSYPGAVVIISHDRYLLDAVVTHIVELEDGRLTSFAGDYSGYIMDKEIRLARQDELFQIQQREINRLKEAAKRYALWGKIYDNEKFAKRAKAMQNRIDRIDRIDRPVLERQRLDLQLGGWRGSTKVLELRSVGKRFGSRQILHPVDLEVRHGERVGVIGPNGSGKSVLLQIILGLEEPDTGEVILGPSVLTGYYAQEHQTLDMEQTLLDAVRYAGRLSEQNAVAFLIRYLFTYRQTTLKIKELSGGERSRLQLALLVLSGANFLLLDEPTNNLDIASAEVLENSLVDFEGTVLVISHDRYFLDRTAKRILAFEQGVLVNYPGGFSDYLQARTERGTGN